MFVVKKFFPIGIVALSLFLISCAATSSQMVTSNYSSSSSNEYLYVDTDDNEAGAKKLLIIWKRLGMMLFLLQMELSNFKFLIKI